MSYYRDEAVQGRGGMLAAWSVINWMSETVLKTDGDMNTYQLAD